MVTQKLLIHLFKDELAPQCIPFNEYFNVKHFLLDCQDLKHIRDMYFNVNSLKELFQNIPGHRIIAFLKESNIYKKI